MAGKRVSPPLSPILIGNCEVEIDGGKVTCEMCGKRLVISHTVGSRIEIPGFFSASLFFFSIITFPLHRLIALRAYLFRLKFKFLLDFENFQSPFFMTAVNDFHEQCDHLVNNNPMERDIGYDLPSMDILITIVHPKNANVKNDALLQEVLKLYSKELPNMKYAANTGKKSPFLERCLRSGKYWTFILSSESIKGPGEVIAALSYQLISADMRYAEIPLVAVEKNWQKKGIGRFLYQELSGRLQKVGVTTIFCWGDKESEVFWHKQGFISIGEVDNKGKIQKLPIKADIRRALSFPGGSVLLLAQLKDINCVNSREHGLLQVSTSQRRSAGSCHVCDPELTKSTIRPSVKPVGSSKLIAETGFSKDEQIDQDKRSCQVDLMSSKSKRVRCSRFMNLCHDFTCQGKDSDYLNYPKNGGCYRILLMDIADGIKKTWLTKIIEELGGSITSDGSECTHVVTAKARGTLNFCNALSFGAWILSSNWLKVSSREGKFLDESPFILEDEDYLLKYKCKLREAMLRAKAHPGMLLSGCQICLSKHIKPSADTLSSIIKSSGGEVVSNLANLGDPSKLIFLACEESMSEALAASKGGGGCVRIFTVEWLMSCVMRQEIDLHAQQFAESLG